MHPWDGYVVELKLIDIVDWHSSLWGKLYHGNCLDAFLHGVDLVYWKVDSLERQVRRTEGEKDGFSPLC